jgi:transposase
VIRFLLARNNNAAEIHRNLCEVYGSNVMSDSKVRQWCRLFQEGRTNVHDKERSGRPSVINDNLVEKVNTTIRGNRRFTIHARIKGASGSFGNVKVIDKIIYCYSVI